MNPETLQKIAEIEARAEAASKGPWVGEACYSGRTTIAKMRSCDELWCVNSACEEGDVPPYEKTKENMAFIENSIEDIPFLIGVIREQERPVVKINKEQYIRYEWCRCPECGKPEVYRSFNYCPDCGVKLEWEEGK